MKRTEVLIKKQNGVKSYVGVIDPRVLVKLATVPDIEKRGTQEDQRPVEKSRLSSIAEYIGEDGKGLLSTSIVIGTVDNRLNVYEIREEDEHGVETGRNRYFIDLPESEEEFERYKSVIKIMDGQHRVFSFLPKYFKIREDVPYEIAYEIYITPTKKERQYIFKNTNEKQKAVESNFLLWLRADMELLEPKEKKYHGIINSLNSENNSPYKGRIIMGAERKPNGIKANSLINVLNKSGVKEMKATLDDEKLYKVLAIYFRGWEKAVGVPLSKSDSSMGPFTKIAGFRYMISMFSYFISLADKKGEYFSEEFVKQNVEKLYAYYGCTANEYFNEESVISQKRKEKGENPFGGESPTIALAKLHGSVIETFANGKFDSLANI